MLLRTLCFDPTIFRKNLSRFWPLWAVALLGFLIVGPVRLLTNSIDWDPIDIASMANETVAYMGAYGSIIAVLFGPIVATAVFSYQFQARSAITMNALPFKRSCLYFTNYISGLVMLMIPLAVGVLLMGLAEIILGCLNISGLLMWFTAQTLSYLYFYSFAVLCACLVANGLGMVLCYIGFSALPMVVWSVIDQICYRFLYGYTSGNALSKAAQWMTPIFNLTESLDILSNRTTLADGITLGPIEYYIQGWTCLIVYAVVGIIMAIPAGLLYHKRKVETAGDLVAFPFLRPVFKYLVAICAGGVAGEFFYMLLIPDGSNTQIPVNLGAYLLFAALGCFVGYFAAQMLLDKTPWVFRGRGRWLGWVASSLAVMAVVLTIRADLFGYEDDQPARTNIASVTLDGNWNSVTNGILTENEEMIDQVVAIHKTIIDQRETLQEEVVNYLNDREIYYMNGGISNELENWNETHRQYSVYLTYELHDGSIFERSYRIYLGPEKLEDETSPTSLINDYVSSPEYTALAYSWMKEVNEDRDELNVRIPVTYYDETADTYCDVEAWLSGENALTVLNAMQADLAEGTLAAASIYRNFDVGAYDWSSISVEVSTPMMMSLKEYNETYSYTRTVSAEPVPVGEDSKEMTSNYYEVMLTEESSHTIEVLTDLGVLNENYHLITSGWHREHDYPEYQYNGMYYDQDSGKYVMDGNYY